jgi:hypothetical protein
LVKLAAIKKKEKGKGKEREKEKGTIITIIRRWEGRERKGSQEKEI